VSIRDASLTLVLDTDPRWEKAADAKQKIAVVAIGDDTVRRVTELGPARIVVNLTNPKALAALIGLREAGLRTRIWGCVANAATGRGLMLGVVEPAARPLDPNAVLALVEQYGTKNKRVLTMGDDVDAFISLRQALTRAGMSVSMAWNGKQAVDLVPMVRPHLLVVDLGVAAADAAPVLGLVAATTPNSITVLMAGAKDAAPTFARALEGAASPASLQELVRRLPEPAMS
jgi:CheY-like chemotaxis protein